MKYALLTILAAGALGAAGCVDERVVYVDKQLLDGVPQSGNGFAGYSNAAEKKTVCGNCHVGLQADWQETQHADAAHTLANAAGAAAFCEGCHNVGDKGNESAEGGWTTSQDERYADVQCESCHGAGVAHASDPKNGTEPLASIASSPTKACGECHSGSHNPFAEELGASRHGPANAYPAGRPECAACHEAKAALAGMGVKSEYVEQGSTSHVGITCAVCHDPHKKKGEGQLRMAVDVADEEHNLCMTCHHKRGKIDETAPQRGAHSPEGPMLLGTAGWWPAGVQVSAVTTHGSERNPKLCVGCHMNRKTVNDADGKFLYQATGHSFEATPCLDEKGIPGQGNCEISQRSFKTCAAGGCHGSEGAARSAQITAEMRVKTLADEIARLLALVPANQFNATDKITTVGEGAKFNRTLVTDKKGNAVHNPFLLETLLIESIKALKSTYGLSATTGLSLTPALQE